MLILGQKYKFTPLELERLNRQFDAIETIAYKDETTKEVIEKIEHSLKERDFTIIILNTKAKVDDELIRYLTNIKYKIKNSKFKIIAIEHFLEEYFYKCYIPEDNNDLHYLDDIKGFTPFQKFQKKIIDLMAVVGLFFLYKGSGIGNKRNFKLFMI